MNTNDSKSGFVAVIGRPNTGKSTLINSLLGQKIAAVSPRPQTTRKKQLGILTFRRDDQVAQIVFVDTPGIHHPRNKLGELMNENALQAIKECDCILIIMDASQEIDEDDQLLSKELKDLPVKIPVIMAINKADLVDPDALHECEGKFQAVFPQSDLISISALYSQNLDKLVEKIIGSIPSGDLLFPDDQTTDIYEREIAADLIRESALIILRDEIPHGIAVRIDQYLEREEHGAYIEATLFVERESHKPIVIGEKGGMIKKIGAQARKEIEEMSGRKVFLKLMVKVRKGWRDNESILRQFGY